MRRVWLWGIAIVALLAGASTARAQAVHLDRFNVDVDLGPGWTSQFNPNSDTVTSDTAAFQIGKLDPEQCGSGGGAFALTCPSGFSCKTMGDPPSGFVTFQMTKFDPDPDILCIAIGGQVPNDPASNALLADVSTKMLDAIHARHVAAVSATFDGKGGTVRISTGATDVKWTARILPADDPDAPRGVLLAPEGSPERYGVAVSAGPAPCGPAIGDASQTLYTGAAMTRFEPPIVAMCLELGGRAWTFTILVNPGDDLIATSRFALPVMSGAADMIFGAYLKGVTDKYRSNPNQPAPKPDVIHPDEDDDDFPARIHLTAAAARMSPDIDDAPAFGAARFAFDSGVSLTHGHVAPAISFGTGLGADKGSRIAADICLGFGISVGKRHRAFVTGVAGADRSGPDGSNTFGLRGYLGVLGSVRVPLGVAAIDGDAMWNTKEKRLAVGIVPRGMPVVGGLMLHDYDNSSAVMIYVGLANPYGKVH